MNPLIRILNFTFKGEYTAGYALRFVNGNMDMSEHAKVFLLKVRSYYIHWEGMLLVRSKAPK